MVFSCSIFEVSISVSTENLNTHKYVVKIGNKILTAILKIAGSSSFTDDQNMPNESHEISV
jgi:hypothetical protein